MRFKHWLIRKLGHDCHALQPIGTVTFGEWTDLPITRVSFEDGQVVVEYEAGSMVTGAAKGRVVVCDLDGKGVLFGQTYHDDIGIKTIGTTWKLTDHIKLRS